MEFLAKLMRVLEAHNLTCGAIIIGSGTVIARVGDFTEFSNNGLATTLMGDASKATYDAVQSAPLRPCLWSQGSKFAILDSVGDLAVVVVFGQNQLDANSTYTFSKQVAKSIAFEFGELLAPPN